MPICRLSYNRIENRVWLCLLTWTLNIVFPAKLVHYASLRDDWRLFVTGLTHWEPAVAGLTLHKLFYVSCFFCLSSPEKEISFVKELKGVSSSSYLFFPHLALSKFTRITTDSLWVSVYTALFLFCLGDGSVCSNISNITKERLKQSTFSITSALWLRPRHYF